MKWLSNEQRPQRKDPKDKIISESRIWTSAASPCTKSGTVLCFQQGPFSKGCSVNLSSRVLSATVQKFTKCAKPRMSGKRSYSSREGNMTCCRQMVASTGAVMPFLGSSAGTETTLRLVQGTSLQNRTMRSRWQSPHVTCPGCKHCTLICEVLCGL